MRRGNYNPHRPPRNVYFGYYPRPIPYQITDPYPHRSSRYHWPRPPLQDRLYLPPPPPQEPLNPPPPPPQEPLNPPPPPPQEPLNPPPPPPQEPLNPPPPPPQEPLNPPPPPPEDQEPPYAENPRLEDLPEHNDHDDDDVNNRGMCFGGGLRPGTYNDNGIWAVDYRGSPLPSNVSGGLWSQHQRAIASAPSISFVSYRTGTGVYQLGQDYNSRKILFRFGCNMILTLDDITLYFRIFGTVETVEIRHQEGYGIVSFTSAETVRQVLDLQHSQLHVEAYNPR